MRGEQVLRPDFGKAYAADGTSTLDALKAERSKLEARLKQIPIEIANLANTIRLRQEDINWLRSLSNRKRKKWEKEKGVDANTQIYRMEQAIVDYKARISSMSEEKKRIPAQITSITKQIDTLIKGESTGLEKGIDRETAKELGEIELQKERERLAHERSIREIQLKEEQAEQQRQAEAQQRKDEQEQKAAKVQADEQKRNNVLIGIGAVIIIGIIAWIIYKRKFAVKKVGT